MKYPPGKSEMVERFQVQILPASETMSILPGSRASILPPASR